MIAKLTIPFEIDCDCITELGLQELRFVKLVQDL